MANKMAALRKRYPAEQPLLDGVIDPETEQRILEAQMGGFEEVDETIETEYCCPRCSFEWSGNPKPNAPKEKAS